MSQSYIDIPLSSIQSDDNKSYNSVTESSVLTNNTASVKKPKANLFTSAKNAKTNKKKIIQKTKVSLKLKKESNNKKKGQERNKTKKEKQQKKGLKVVKQVVLSSLTSKSKLKLVPKALEKIFNKTSGMPWKKIKIPKDPPLSPTEEKTLLAKHDNEIPIPEKDSLHVPKGLDRSKQAQIDALLNAITTMCALVKDGEK